MTINKIVESTKHLSTDKQIGVAVSSALLVLLKDEEYVAMIEKGINKSWVEQLYEKIGDKKNEIANKIAGIEGM